MVNFLAPEISTIDLEKFMRIALEEAEQAGLSGEIPIGAVLVIGNKVIARGRARHNELKSQIRHAELNALLDGGIPSGLITRKQSCSPLLSLAHCVWVQQSWLMFPILCSHYMTTLVNRI